VQGFKEIGRYVYLKSIANLQRLHQSLNKPGYQKKVENTLIKAGHLITLIVLNVKSKEISQGGREVSGLKVIGISWIIRKVTSAHFLTTFLFNFASIIFSGCPLKYFASF